ncbi:MAG: hypothetical protein U0354_16750, partial [Candidatus Sericytochromatia bacterium]
CIQGLKQTKKTEDKYNYGKGLVALGEIYLAEDKFDSSKFSKFLKDIKTNAEETDSDVLTAYYYYFESKKHLKENNKTEFKKSYKKLQKVLEKVDNKEINIQSIFLELEFNILDKDISNAKKILDKINSSLKTAEFFYLRLEAIYQHSLLLKLENNFKEAQQVIETGIDFAKLRNYKLFLYKAMILDIELKNTLKISSDIDKLNLKRLEKEIK